MDNIPTQKHWTYVLRWIAVIPGAVIGSMLTFFIASFPIHWFLSLYAVMKPEGIISNNIETIELSVTSFVLTAAYVFIGAKIAPKAKLVTSVALIIFLSVIAIFLASTNNFIISNGFRMASSILGLIFAVLFVKEQLLTISENKGHKSYLFLLACFAILIFSVLWYQEPKLDPSTWDCTDFETQAEAQEFYMDGDPEANGDKYHLDKNGDGVACESLPS